MSIPNVWYYGVERKGRPGHYLFDAAMYQARPRLPQHFPVAPSGLDGTFLPPNQAQTEGAGYLWHVKGWTILAFWDRSGDSRGSSNSAFVIERGGVLFEEAVAISRAAFPKIWERFTFEVFEQ